MEKLYMLEVCKDENSSRQPLAYSHSIKKLSGIAALHTNSYMYVGTDGVINSPEVVEVVKYTKSEDGFPVYWIREVPFII